MKIFLDVGAHKGETAQIALEDAYGFDKIYCFEPVAESCKKIRSLRSKKIEVNEFGLWNKTQEIELYSPPGKDFHSASVYKERFQNSVKQKVKMVRSSEWFSQNINKHDEVFLKLNCEGSEYVILADLIASNEIKKIDVLMVDFDVRKIPSQKHLMEEMKNKLNKLNISKIFYIDEFNLKHGTHSHFTRYWLNNSQRHISQQSKILEGLKLKGSPVEIPDCSRDDLPQFFVDMGYKVGAEIGTAKGEFTVKFARVGLTMYAIDPWMSYPDYDGSPQPTRTDFFNTEFRLAKKTLAPYPNCTIIRKTSMQALADFKDNSLDFVYIDGNHQLKYVVEDLVEWSKKVRQGGIVSGHDYIYTNPRTQTGICHVIYALDAYIRAYKITNWYLLGRYERREDEKRDRFRSWMFLKK